MSKTEKEILNRLIEDLDRGISRSHEKYDALHDRAAFFLGYAELALDFAKVDLEKLSK